MSSVFLAMLLAASPAQAGWTETAQKGGCVFSKGSAEGDVLPLRAECRWSVPPEQIIAVLSDWERHDDVFSSVASSRIIGKEGAGQRVLQTHVASGISDRFIVLATGVSDVEGGKRFTFRSAADQSEAAAAAEAGGGVVPASDVGSWEVRSDGQGGSIVVHELRYSAGGSVPGFMVRAFQGGGFQTMLAELQAVVGG